MPGQDGPYRSVDLKVPRFARRKIDMPKWVLPTLGFVACTALGQFAWIHGWYIVVSSCGLAGLGTVIALGVRYG